MKKRYYQYSETNPVPGRRVKHRYFGRKITPMIELFENRFVKGESNKCWEWAGRKDKHGYGRFSHTVKSQLAHRVSYKVYVDGSIDSTIVIRHRCDNTSCVNPNHLIPGTKKDNTKDMMDRNRGFLKVGEGNPFRKLTEAQAVEILKSTLSQKELASIYDVSTGAIWHIKNRTTWKHITI